MADNFNEMVRLLDTDIRGRLQTQHALTKVQGISHNLANALCSIGNFDKSQKIGELTKEDIQKIESLIKNPEKIPSWMFNRRKDKETGEDMHLLKSDLKFKKEMDIKDLQKVKSYIGIRHQARLPVRGQKTRSNFRRGKTIGVRKKGAKK